jgi:hypothetical protein
VILDISEHKSEIENLCRRYDVRQLALFGSSVSADFDPANSDLDFLVEFEPLPSGRYANAYFGLLEALEQLFGRSVDLVVDSAIRNPYFRQSIQRSKTSLYGD